MHKLIASATCMQMGPSTYSHPASRQPVDATNRHCQPQEWNNPAAGPASACGMQNAGGNLTQYPRDGHAAIHAGMPHAANHAPADFSASRSVQHSQGAHGQGGYGHGAYGQPAIEQPAYGQPPHGQPPYRQPPLHQSAQHQTEHVQPAHAAQPAARMAPAPVALGESRPPAPKRKFKEFREVDPAAKRQVCLDVSWCTSSP
jgi:hypothetical protein